ncbi:hypothetical protein L0F63_007154, partial [Massospora cicadina]
GRLDMHVFVPRPEIRGRILACCRTAPRLILGHYGVAAAQTPRNSQPGGRRSSIAEVASRTSTWWDAARNSSG